MPPKKATNIAKSQDKVLDEEPEENADVYDYPKLYKRDARGTIREYEVRVEVLDDGTVKLYRISRVKETSSGEVGRPVIEVRLIRGKVKRSDLEQAQQMAQKFWSDQKTKKGYVEDEEAHHEAPADGEVNLNANIPMTAYVYEPGVTRLRFPVLLQPKYDGSRTIGMCHHQELRFYSRSRKIVYGMPHISDILQPILCGLPQFAGLILDGELMNDQNRQWESSGIMRRFVKGKMTPEQLQEYETFVADTYLVLYDCYAPGHEADPFRDRQVTLREVYRQIPARYHQTIRLAPTTTAQNQTDIMRTFGEHIQANFEGTMIRNPDSPYRHNRTQDLLKLKAIQEQDFIIVDVIPAENEPGSRLVLQTDDGRQFNVRPRGDLEYREYLLKHRDRIMGLKATIQYATLSEDGKPQHPRVGKTQKHGPEYLQLEAHVRET